MAFSGHTLEQRPHPMHPAEQNEVTCFPRQWVEHATNTGDEAGIRSMTCLGQFRIHAPQEMQRVLSTSAMPSEFTFMAFTGQFFSQVPPPIQLV